MENAQGSPFPLVKVWQAIDTANDAGNIVDEACWLWSILIIAITGTLSLQTALTARSALIAFDASRLARNTSRADLRAAEPLSWRV